jgi:hypothetical protein
MHTVARAFTGAALFIGGLDISPTFSAGKPQASIALFSHPIRPGVNAQMRSYLRSRRSFEVISPREVRWLDRFTTDRRSTCGPRSGLSSSANARPLRRTTRSLPIEYFTTSRRKFSEHFV